MKKINLFLLLAFFAGILQCFATQYCDFATGHLGEANFGDANGRILLSLEPTGNTNEFKLTVKPNAVAGNTQKLDYLYVIGSGNNPYPAESGSDSGPALDEISVTFTNANTTTSFTIQWSTPNWGGKWQCTLTDVNLKSLTSCSAAPAEDDTEAPVMTSASLSSKTHNSAVIAVAATDNVGVTKYVVYNGVSKQGEYTPSEGKITITGLTPSTAYTLTVKAKDAAGNESGSGIDVAFTTQAAPAFVIDWDLIGWITDSNNKYKIYGQEAVSVQKPDFATASGIYMNLGDVKYTTNIKIQDVKALYDVQGTGVVLHLSNFTAKETKVITDDKTFYIYYEDGTTGGEQEDEEQDEDEEQGGDSYAPTFTESGTIPDRTETYTYTVVQNSNGTLTITLTLSAALDGWAVPEFYTTGSDRSNMSQWENLTSTYTTTIQYPTTTDTSNWRLRIPYTGAAAEISMSNYTVGADNTHCGKCFRVTF